MYEAFAQVYDALMSDVDYAGWARHYRALLTRTGVADGARIAECACGTGGLTVPLARMGYRMTGVDASSDMLSQAAGKARAAGCMIPFAHMDMRALRLHRPADAVLATCDGVNYLLSEADARAFFAAAHQALTPGGALIFDISTPEKLKGTLGDHTLCDFDERMPYMWRNAWDESHQTVTMSLSVFARLANGTYRRVNEEQTQRAHTQDELRTWLQSEGFSEVTFYGERRMDAPRAGDTRWHVMARRARAQGVV